MMWSAQGQEAQKLYYMEGTKHEEKGYDVITFGRDVIR